MKTKLMTEITPDGLYVHDEQGYIYVHQEELARIIEEVQRPVGGNGIILALLASGAIYLGLYTLFVGW